MSQLFGPENRLLVLGSLSGGAGVTAGAVIADNTIVRGDGGARGVQGSSVTITDTGLMIIGAGLTTTGLDDLTINPAVKVSGSLLELKVGGVSKANFAYDGALTVGNIITVGTLTLPGGGVLSGASGAITATTASNGNFAFALNGTGQVILPVGAVATPSLGFSGAATTGLFFKAANNPAIVGPGATVSLSLYTDSLTEQAFIQAASTTFTLGSISGPVVLKSANTTALTLGTDQSATFAGTISAITTGTITRTALGTTSADGLIVQNTTDAAAGAQQLGPRIGSWGEGWKTDATAASIVVGSGFETLPVEGAAAPTLTMRFFSKIGAAAVTYPMTLTSAGALTTTSSISSGGELTAASNVNLGAANYIAFSGRSLIISDANGTVLLRNNAGSAGTTLDVATNGTLKVRNLANDADAAITAGAGTFSGAVTTSSSTRSGPGAVAITTSLCKVTSTGVADALTLADGVDGQRITIVHDVDGGSFVLTPATKTGWTTFTSTVVGETITLVFVTTRGWMVTGSYLGVIAP